MVKLLGFGYSDGFGYISLISKKLRGFGLGFRLSSSEVKVIF